MRINRSPTETALSRAVLRWRLTRPTPVADTDTSHIYRVEREGAGPAALKIIRPGMREELRGALVQAWYAGEGAAEVFEANAEAVLMEWLEGPELARRSRENGSMRDPMAGSSGLFSASNSSTCPSG